MIDIKDATKEILAIIINPNKEKSQEVTVVLVALPTRQVKLYNYSKV
jgi:chorismate mutase